jgi:DNA-binding transcriptional ArsR family regulator
MTYVYDINQNKNMTQKKASLFEEDLQRIAELSRVMSHPARLAILRYLAKCNTCISGDISNEIPLSRTTVSQHLKELKKVGLIHGTIDGLKVNYCLCSDCIKDAKLLFEGFLKEIYTKQPNQC